MSTITDRVPRSLMKIQVKDLKLGEGFWYQAYAINVLLDGRVFIKKRADSWNYHDSQHGPKHNNKGDFLVRLEEEGLTLHIFKDDGFLPYDRNMEPWDLSDAADLKSWEEFLEDRIQITRIVLHTKDTKVCDHCHGAGFVERKPPGI